MKVTVIAPAKINLYLEVQKKDLAESLHSVETVMQTVSLFDYISIKCTKSRRGINSIFVSSNSRFLNELPTKSNLACLACQSFFQVISAKGFSVRIKINKVIPIGAGLAGGSADAAGVLLGLNFIFGNVLSLEELNRIAKTLGSDVPFCLVGSTVFADETGSRLIKLPNLTGFYILICKPRFNVCTRDAYNFFDCKYGDTFYRKHCCTEIISAVKKKNLNEISQNVYNRFEEVIESSEIQNIKHFMKNYGALVALMSGSGSSVFGLFEDINTAKKCEITFKKMYQEVYICEPINFGCKIINRNH